MQTIYETLQRIGLQSLDYLWFPMLIWTLVALVSFLAFRAFQKLNPLYHYHLRVATLAAIPFGLMAAFALQYVGSLSQTLKDFDPTLFVVTTPQTFYLSETSFADTFSPNWFEPNFLIGFISVLIVFISIFMIFRLGFSFINLKRLQASLSKQPLTNLTFLNSQEFDHVKLSFQDHPMVPFTFGWKQPIIVLPTSIQDDPEKVRMAVHHELVHIQRGDYLLQLFLSVIESIFWFHPLIYFGSREIETYREISCDQQVLNTSGISLKNYATMLYELLPLNRGLGSFSVSMAVQSSTLKKRIETMKYHKLQNTSLKRSLLFLILMITAVTIPIACSDMRVEDFSNEKELMGKQLIINSPTLTINGKEVAIEKTESGLPLPASVVLGTKDYGTFVISPFRFEGGTSTGTITGNNIEFRINQFNVKLLTETEIISDSKVQIWIKHYPYIKITKPSTELIYTTIDGAKIGDTGFILSLFDASIIAPPPPPTEEDFFVVVEEMPQLIGGLASIQNKVQYPEMARRAGIEGTVVLQFIVNENGDVENPKIIRGIGGGCDEAALEAIKLAKYEPGIQRGRPVRVQYSLPIVFRLNDSDFTSSEEVGNGFTVTGHNSKNN